MASATLRLPIRLLPRKRWYILLMVGFFGVFFSFALFWIVAAAQPGMHLQFNEETVTDPLIRSLFPLFGLPFLLVGAGGLAAFGARLLPRSPYHHVEVSAEGLRVRTLTKPKDFAWRDLPAFETLEVVNSDSDGTTRTYYAIAMRSSAPATPAKSAVDPREIVRVPAEEYGAKDTMDDAQMLADWLNQVRDHALMRRDGGIGIPEALLTIAIGAPPAKRQSAPGQTVIRR